MNSCASGLIRRFFNRKSYAGVSIEEIMSNAGLTHGGFYRHFTGKDELYAAAVRDFCALAASAFEISPTRTAKSISRAA
jgi:AcrR family transcriptional regulator